VGRITELVTPYIGAVFYNSLLKVQIQGRIEVTGILGRRRKQLLDDLKETR